MLTITVDSSGHPSAKGFSSSYCGALADTYSETDILRHAWYLAEIVEE